MEARDKLYTSSSGLELDVSKPRGSVSSATDLRGACVTEPRGGALAAFAFTRAALLPLPRAAPSP